MNWRRSHIVEMLLLLVGVACLGTFLWDQVATLAEQRTANLELERELEQARPAEAERSRTPDATSRLKTGAVVGRVEIPRLKIAAMVRSGVDDKTLRRSVGHVPSTALPGQPGNVGLAAHRDSFFRNLKGVREGDVIRIVTPEGDYTYHVESTKIVTPKNVEVLNPTREKALTLVTCYPFNYVGSAPKRFIVRARQVEAEQTTAGL